MNNFEKLDDFGGCYCKSNQGKETTYKIKEVGYYIKTQLEKGRNIEDIAIEELEPFKI